MYYNIPPKVKANAKIALLMKQRGFKGGTLTGWRRGRQLADGGSVSIDDIKDMKRWFARHKYTSYPGFKKWEENGKPTVLYNPSISTKYRAAVAYNLWGGREGEEWVMSFPLDN